MCQSVSTLVYGVPVRTMSLLFAADAWPDLQPPLRFFALVSLRARQGAFCSTSSAVQSVPVEVWDLIRNELVSLELDDQECDFVQSMTSDDGHAQRCRVKKLGARARVADLARACKKCEQCAEDSDNALMVVEDSISGRLDPLLRAFCLSIPDDPLVILRRTSDDWFDYKAATYLVVPGLTPAPQGRALEAYCGGGAGPNQQAILPLTFARPPPGTVERLRRLIRLLHLESLKVVTSKEKLSLSASTDSTLSRAFKHVPVSTVKPRWVMLTTCVEV
ncbi:hypothetical protein JCM8097_001323 [Rhodosporidiobolus ruineniae]